jgi:two-component system NarL family sensor kinase
MRNALLVARILTLAFGAALRFAAFASSDSLFNAGDYAGYLKAQLILLQQAEQAGEPVERAQAVRRVGRAHYYLKDKDEARRWMLRGASIAMAADADTIAAACWRSIGAIHWEQGKPDSARHFLDLAEPILVRQADAAELATHYGIRFELHFRSLRDTLAGEHYAALGEQYARRTGDPERIAFALMKRGILYMETGRCAESIATFTEGERIYTDAGHLEGLGYALNNLATAYGLCGMAKECAATYRRHDVLRDSLFKSSTADRAAHYQALFDTQQKEIENLELRERNQRAIAGAVVGVLLVAFLSFAVYKRRELRRQRMHEAALRDEQLLGFRGIVTAQEMERARIAADLHDGIGHQLGALKLTTSVLEGRDAQERSILEKSRAMIDDAARDVRSVSHRLMPRSLEELGLLPALRELADRIGTSGHVRVAVHGADGAASGLDEAAQLVLYRIAQEMIANALKHAQATQITVGLERQEQCVRLTIADDGVGFDTERMKNGDGMGWRNARSRVGLIGGTLNVRSAPGKGATTVVEAPIHDQPHRGS